MSTYTATLSGDDPNNDYEPVTITEQFEDWIYQGKLVCPIEDVINDWAYNYFDKGSYTIDSIEIITQ